MSEFTRPTDEELHAFIDGELDRADTLRVAAAIERDDELAHEVAAFKADKARLQQVYKQLLAEPIPAAWIDMIERSVARRRLRLLPTVALPRALMALAASLVLIIGGLLAYRGLDRGPGDALVAEAIAAHTGTMASPAAAALPDAGAVLSRTLGLALKAPDLSKMGYVLERVDVYAAAPGGAAVKLDYRGQDNRHFTLYLRPSPGTPRFDMLREGGSRICIWQDDVLSTIMVGEMSAGEMLRLASLAYAGLT